MKHKRHWKKPSEPLEGLPEGDAQRLQKVLAAKGLGSRREIEKWILQGRISVDRKPASLGQKINGNERICLDGRVLEGSGYPASGPRVIIYHKPEGEIVSRSDPDFKATVFDNLPTLSRARWIAVGRLDVNSRGLLLLTTDGELAYRLTHPRYAVEREYAVRVLGEVSSDGLAQLRQGVELEEGPAKFEHVEFIGGDGANRWYQVTLQEGRNREVRRLWEAVGTRVSRLIRVRYGSVTLPRELRSGKCRELDPAARSALYESVGLKPPQRKPGTPPKYAKRHNKRPVGKRQRRV